MTWTRILIKGSAVIMFCPAVMTQEIGTVTPDVRAPPKGRGGGGGGGG